MLRSARDVQTVHVEKMKGGKGSLAISHLLQEGEFCGKGRLFSRSVLKPGASVGVHTHTDDFEVYYFIKGSGMYADNDKSYPVGPGDVTICHDGDSHGVENTGTEDLEFIALILFTK